MHIEQIINHLGEEERWSESVVPPIFQSTNFCFKTVEEMRNRLMRESDEPFYTRGVNPTVKILRQKLAALEHTEDALVFSSGSAAISSAVIAHVKSGDHIISVAKPYSWTKKLLQSILSKFGVEHTFVDGTSPDNFKKAIQPNTRMILLESPNSITFELQDLRAIATIAQEYGIVTLCDNSHATPLFQNPHLLGIALVAHSASKYIGGHSDVVAGVLCGSRERLKKVFAGPFMTLGTNISPHDAWLLIRGLRTLPMRVKQADESGLRIAKFLQAHPKVDKVYHPFLESNSQYELARSQMRGAGGLVSVQLKTTVHSEIEEFCNSLKLFLMACSWGGYESLQFPQLALYSSENYASTTMPANLIRLYVGLDDVEDLIEDLKAALDKLP